MLVLSRKHGESITVGSDTVVEILSIRGKTVRLGIQAPDSVKIVRLELTSDDPNVTASVTSRSSESC